MLEMQILDSQPRVPWGINNAGPQSEVFSKRYPGYRESDETLDIPREKHLIGTEQVNGPSAAVLAPKIHVPLAPFMEIMAVAPIPVVGQPGVTVAGVQRSTAPGPFGGNLDVKDVKAGTTPSLTSVSHRRLVLCRCPPPWRIGRR